MELSLADVIGFVKKYFLIIIIAGVVGGIGGYLYTFLLPKKYTAQTILLPEYSMSNNNSFFSMATGGEKTGAEKLTPDLYPNILQSLPYGQFMLTVPVIDAANKAYPNLREYLLKDSEIKANNTPDINSSSKIKQNPALKDILVLNNQENSLANSAARIISASVEPKSGITTLSAEMTDPVVAAILVETSKNYLVKYIEDYRTTKTSEQVEFLEKRVSEAKKRQQNAEYSLQSYRDHNRGAFLNVARIEEQRLQTDYTLAQSIYSDLTFKLEQAKIKVKEEKPVFKVLEPTKVPLDKSSPNRTITAMIFGVAGAILALFYIIFIKEKLHLKLIHL